MARIAINGFGRIGRAAFKIILERKKHTVVALNDLTDTATLAHLLKYDTAYGRYGRPVTSKADSLVVGGKTYPVFAEKDPTMLPWKKLKVDVVIESTGRFLTKEKAGAHLIAGAKSVLLSAPAKDKTIGTVVPGVNSKETKKFCKRDHIISNASCTTNSIAPIAEVMNRVFGVEKALMTTIHSYTADQNLVDGPHKDLRRARAAAQNIVPTTTGAAKATTKTIPALEGKFDGIAVRVPTLVGSLSDFTFVLKKNVTVAQVNKALEKASQSPAYKGKLTVTYEPLVSSDIVGTNASSIADLSLTMVVDGNLVKVVAWYDNEWGYTNRLIDTLDEMV